MRQLESIVLMMCWFENRKRLYPSQMMFCPAEEIKIHKSLKLCQIFTVLDKLKSLH